LKSVKQCAGKALEEDMKLQLLPRRQFMQLTGQVGFHWLFQSLPAQTQRNGKVLHVATIDFAESWN
jgi:hypothetical protein